ncbi:MAG TPA: formate dehydrogenase accessory protein FdhE [Candidatus Sulfotelmatobacter sp.]
MPTETNVRTRWDARIRRAQELVSKHSAIANALRLYLTTLEFQAELASRFETTVDPGAPLRRQIDLSAVVSALPTLLTIAAERGPDQLRFEAHRMRQLGPDRWRPMVEEVLASGDPVSVAAHDFFARACLQPLAENLQVQLPNDPGYTRNVCPACGGLPQLAIERPGGDAPRRSLLCSLCFCEWSFPRGSCPACGVADEEKLPHYKSDEWKYIHVEACDNCQNYLKVVDLAMEPNAVPLIDEAALAVLDVWATGLGYTKIIRNLIGF